MERLTPTDRGLQRNPSLLALWLAARSLGFKQGSLESGQFEEMEDKEDGHGT